MNGKFKDRKEQRKVTETMNALLLPLLSYCNNDTKDIIERALYLLGEIEIEPQESEDKKTKKTYCTECPYFTDVVYDCEQYYGARCKKDGHSTMPSMYAIKSLHDSCPLMAESEDK